MSPGSAQDSVADRRLAYAKPLAERGLRHASLRIQASDLDHIGLGELGSSEPRSATMQLHLSNGVGENPIFRATDMQPATIVHNTPDVNAELRTDHRDRYAARVEPSDLDHVTLGEFCHRVVGSDEYRTRSTSSLANPVLYVVLVGSKKQVGMVAAFPVVTTMQHMETVGYGSDPKLVCHAMRAALVANGRVIDGAVSGVGNTPGPWPARVGPARAVDLGVKSFSERYSRSHYVEGTT